MNKTRRAVSVTAAAAMVVAAVGGVAAAISDRLTAGPQPDGTAVATYGWRITPAGQQNPSGRSRSGQS